jgi:hypothetical protein
VTSNVDSEAVGSILPTDSEGATQIPCLRTRNRDHKIKVRSTWYQVQIIVSTKKLMMFSCDLVSNAKKHIQFLKDIHPYTTVRFASLQDEPVTADVLESLRRYENLWLPLLSETPTEPPELQLIPPPDIAWLWYCHRLAPQQYIKYCRSNFQSGRIIEANPPFSMIGEVQAINVIASTKKLWKQKYPNEKFYLPNDDVRPIASSIDNDVPVYPLLDGFDLIGSAKRQVTFLWQVSGKEYSDDQFLHNGVENYEKFLRLTDLAMQQDFILVPTLQIDLMWHTHILTSIQNYNADCIQINNHRMYHDDSLTDRTEGGILDTSYNATKELWESTYDTDYVVDGGMYRGEPPLVYYTSKWLIENVNDIAMSNLILDSIYLCDKVEKPSSLPTRSVQKKWVSKFRTASDGRPAFLRIIDRSINRIRLLPYKQHYVLGRYMHYTGYFHIETLEAHTILYHRLDACVQRIALEMCCYTCFYCGEASANEQRKMDIIEIRTMQNKLQIHSRRFNNEVIIDYPKLYACAGGACGGRVCMFFSLPLL